MATTADQVPSIRIDGAGPRPFTVRNHTAITFDQVPDTMPERAVEAAEMHLLLAPILEGAPRFLALTGDGGVGKSSLARRVCRDFAKAAERRNGRVHVVHLNCRARRTAPSVLIGILTVLRGVFPDRGFSDEEMLRALRKALEPDKRLILVLDEADSIRDAELFHYVTRFNEEYAGSPTQVSVIILSRQDLLDRIDGTTFFHRIVLRPYARDALLDIVRRRAEAAFYPGTVDDAALSLIAESAGGNARNAIYILQRAALKAQLEGAARLDARHVDPAVLYDVRIADIRNEHERILLEAILLMVERGKVPPFTTGQVIEAYNDLCTTRALEPRGHTQCWTYICSLSDAGFIDAQRSGRGTAGSTTIIRPKPWLRMPHPDSSAKVERLLTFPEPDPEPIAPQPQEPEPEEATDPEEPIPLPEPEPPELPKRAEVPTRIRILQHVTRNPGQSVREVAAAVGCSEPSASIHIGNMRKQGRVESMRDGKNVRVYVRGAAPHPGAAAPTGERVRAEKAAQHPAWCSKTYPHRGRCPRPATCRKGCARPPGHAGNCHPKPPPPAPGKAKLLHPR